METITEEGVRVLDDAARLIHGGAVTDGMRMIQAGLFKKWKSSNTLEWDTYVRRVCRPHPLRKILHQDPFTKRCFDKPRGYPGDAVTLDYIYFPERFHGEIASPGKEIFNYATDSPSSRADRERVRICAKLIDEVASKIQGPRIMSVASGHLREAEYSEAFRNDSIASWLALDQDAETLAVVNRDYGRNRHLLTLKASIRDLIRGEVSVERFDLIYAIGISDYLTQAVVQGMLRLLFNKLSPGGFLLCGNFAPGIVDIGYIDAYMDWKMIYRDEQDIKELLALIPPQEIASADVFREKNENIILLKIRKS